MNYYRIHTTEQNTFQIQIRKRLDEEWTLLYPDSAWKSFKEAEEIMKCFK